MSEQPDPQFDAYRALLDLAKQHAIKGALHQAVIKAGINLDQNEPISGFFRYAKKKGASPEPVGIWRNAAGVTVFYLGSKQIMDKHTITKIWQWCAFRPVSFDHYNIKLDTGEWPDTHAFVDDVPDDDFAEDENPAGIGHNSGIEEDPAAALERAIQIAQAGVKKYAVIENGKFKSLIASDDMRNASQTLRSELLVLMGRVEKHREAINRPHLDALKVNNDKWMPFSKEAKASADFVNKAQSAYETQKLLVAEAERHRIEAEEEAANEAREAAAYAANAAAAAGEPAPEPPVPQPKIEEPARVAPTTSFRGGSGRAASVKPVTVITEVTDYAALFAYFVANERLRAEVLKEARRVLKDTGEIPPGCTTSLEAKVA